MTLRERLRDWLLGQRETEAGESAPEAAGLESITVIEAEVDDSNPEWLGYAGERALELGALDFFYTPVVMKKNRPGALLTLLARPEDAERFMGLLLAETTTLGVRQYSARRRVLERRWAQVETPWGPVRVKEAWSGGQRLNSAPEYEDCRAIARGAGVPLKEVYAAALASHREHPAAPPPDRQHSNPKIEKQ